MVYKLRKDLYLVVMLMLSTSGDPHRLNWMGDRADLRSGL